MKNIFFKITGIGICLVALGLNLQHAFDGYGVKKQSLHSEVLAQTNSGGSSSGGSSSGGSSSGGSSSGGSSSGGNSSGGDSSGGGTEMICYSSYRTTRKNKREPEWSIQACNDCTQVSCFEYKDPSKCIKEPPQKDPPIILV